MSVSPIAGSRMLAEILEQPDVLLEVRARAASWKPRLSRTSSIVVFGSGSSFNVALLARHYFESLAGVPTRVAFASEAFRYDVPVTKSTLAVALSHSGRSADVRAAVKRAKKQGIRTLGLTNIEGSPLTREADAAIVTGAGRERAVPSTKGFTAMVAACLALASPERAGRLLQAASRALGDWLENQNFIASAVEAVVGSKAVVLLGGDLLYPVARDGALKLLEVTYIPSTAYPPEEFRHGPVAMVEPGVAVVTLGKTDRGTRRRVDAAGASLVTLDPEQVPRVARLAQPFVYAPPLQLLAHAVGSRLGRAIDAPRGLTKVVGA